MKKLVKPLALTLGGILLLLILLAIDVARFAGEFRSFQSAFAGSCAAIALGGSSEDIQVDRQRGLAYLSVLNRDGEPDTRISQVYADDGAQLSLGTVAAHWRDEFLVGALLENKVLICKPNP